MEFFGLNAKVYLKYSSRLENLANILSKGLMIPSFFFDTDMDPPHDVTGMCESLGSDLWLEKNSDLEDFSYLLTLETKLSIDESFNNKMHDISPWLARYISKVCEIKSCIVGKTGKKIIFKVESKTTK